ncbi:PTS sugar transporter subunit IIA [bacterium]|nr:PTS sugar transporter subunit IIA [bacterium]
MNLNNSLKTECIEIGLKVSSKSEALRQIARIAKRCAVLSEVDEEQLFSAFLEREELGTTGFGRGIAIPHCRIEGIDQFVVGIITVPDGVDFDSIDGERVNIIVFIVAPAAESSEHIKLLSRISHILNLPGIREEILKSHSPDVLRENFLRHILEEEEPKAQMEKKLFHIFVQNDDMFREILQVLSAIASSSLFVIEAKNTREYLAKTHLFSAFWKDEKLFSSKVILAVVDKRLVNETIRQIERITGVLERCRNVLLIVQDTFFVSGNIET